MTISKLALTVTIIVGLSLSAAPADIDPGNPDWLIYRDPDGETTAEQYDQYMEATPGETFTLDVVVNRDPPAGVANQVVAYVSAFWYDRAVVGYGPVPNYALSWMQGMTNPSVAANWLGYVQLVNEGPMQSIWESPAANPFVVMSWDITILPDAPLGESPIAMRFRTYDVNGTIMDANSLETYPAFIINVVPEPTTVGMLAVGAAAVLRRKR